MKTGIIVNDISNLAGWEQRIVNAIVDHDALSLRIIIQDNRIGKITGFKQKMGSKILRIQREIEDAIKNTRKQNDNSNIPRLNLSGAKIIHIQDTTDGFDSEISDTCIQEIIKFELDLLIKLDINNTLDQLRGCSKHGLWSLAIGDQSPKDRKLAGLWEILKKAPYVNVKLVQQSKDDESLIIDTSLHFNHWSLCKSSQYLMNSASSLLLKNIVRLSINKFITQSYSMALPPANDPGIFDAIKYLIYYYRKLLLKGFGFIGEKYLRTSNRPWSLFYGKGDFFSAPDPSTLKKLSPPRGTFWADPFFFRKGNDEYVFFESFPYRKRSGKISCGTLTDGELHHVIDVLKKDYHLSYPSIFEEDGKIFMMPETSENRRLEIYECVEFPLKWKLYATSFDGEAVVDATYFRDKSGQRWLFLNKGFGDYFDTELHIYSIDSLTLNTIKSHTENPVIIDASRARNAGPLFWVGDQLIRPSQNNSFGTYGYGLNLNRIDKLTLEEYSETTISTTGPDDMPGFRSLHHLHQLRDKFIVDGVQSR